VRTLLCATCLLLSTSVHGASREVTFAPAASSVQAYDIAEVTVHVASPDAMNPFTDVIVTGTFGKRGEETRTAVEGFCDSPDGSVFRIRFVPSSPGDYTYAVTYRQTGFEKTATGNFTATDGHRPVWVEAKALSRVGWTLSTSEAA